MASVEVQIDNNDDLENLLAKATNPLHRQPDPDSLSSFCALIDKEKDGPQTALRLLAHKIQSPIEKESLIALSVLEETVKKCGGKFRSEVGKFRFLNEMIKVVSPKYLGKQASSKVKQKIVELLFLWSMELKQETKINEAYQMLKRQGVVIEDPLYILDTYEPPLPPPPPPRPKNAIFEDEEKAQQLQKLLRSRNAEDLQAANRLIKNMVREADRKMELLAKRSTELETVHNNASVLNDMLNHYKPGVTSPEELDLLKELFESCERLRPKLFRLAGELDEKDEGLNDILKANDELTVAINNYKKKVGTSNENGTSTLTCPTKEEASLLDLGSPLQETPQKTTDTSLLDDQLLALGLDMPLKNENPNQTFTDTHSLTSSSKEKATTSLADLDQIFTVDNSASENNLKTSLASSTTVTSLATSVIKPVFSSSMFQGGDSSDIPSIIPHYTANTTSTSYKAPVSNTTSTSKGLEQLDELGQLLLKKSLPPNSAVKLEFPSTPQKVPLNRLKEQSENKPLAQKKSSFVECNLTSQVNSNEVTVLKQEIANSSEGIPSPIRSPTPELLSLKDIYVSLETVLPGSLPPLTIHEKNNMNIVIHFGKDSPRPDIIVMVVSMMSKNSSPIKNVSFHAAVPKTMKIKLQLPSATDLPAHNPILPPAAITQVILLSNPNKEIVRFKYKVSYKINEEEFSDVGEIENLFAPR